MAAPVVAAERPSMTAKLTWNDALRLAGIHTPQPPALLCCGQWRPIVLPLPFTAPCCGRVYFTELAHQQEEKATHAHV